VAHLNQTPPESQPEVFDESFLECRDAIREASACILDLLRKARLAALVVPAIVGRCRSGFEAVLGNCLGCLAAFWIPALCSAQTMSEV